MGPPGKFQNYLYLWNILIYFFVRVMLHIECIFENVSVWPKLICKIAHLNITSCSLEIRLIILNFRFDIEPILSMAILLKHVVVQLVHRF